VTGGRGKLTGGSRPSAAPGGREAERRDGCGDGLGRLVRVGEKRESGWAPVARVTGWWPTGVFGLVNRFEFERLFQNSNLTQRIKQIRKFNPSKMQ
jgi:hypothetical protein